jgi:NADH:ubiquinone oxidoreductase subunit 2 (subunit N)
LVGPIKLFYVILLNYLVILQKDVGNFFFIFGIFCILFGLIITLNQTILKRFIAWTGIFYFGVFLLFLSNVNIENQFFLKVYITIYILSSLLIILYSKMNILRLTDLMYLFGDNFIFGLSFLTLLIVIIGLPIMSGFFGKLMFYYSLLSTTGSLLFILFLIILTSYAFYYYLSLLIYGLSYKIQSTSNIVINSSGIKLHLLVYIALIFNIILFLFPSQFAELFLYFI